jgi:predicted NACHT family NTPase
MPVYVALHQLAQGPLGRFEDVFLPDPEFQAVVNGGGANETLLRLYLDGLDEIPDQRRQQEIIELVRSKLATTPQLSVVITAREHVGGPWLSWLPGVELSELTAAQVRELVGQLLGADSAKIDGFFHQLSLVPTLQSLTGVPLLTMLIVAAYQHMGSLPENRVELYRIFVDLMCGGWDIAKGIRRGAEFGPAPKTAILMRLATILHHNRSREATAQQFKRVVCEFAPGLANRWESVLSDILQDGLLIQNGAAFIFRHLSFQEYLSAVDLADPTNNRKDQTLGWYFQGDDWWREVLTFYIGISKKPGEVSQWLDAGAAKAKRKGSPGVERLAQLRRALTDAFPAFA